MPSRGLLTLAAALAGAALFYWAVRSAGVPAILDGIQRVGWGLLVIIALGGVRFALRSAGWRLCMPPQTRLPFPQAFGAFLAGDAVGSVTPLGLIASEPAKVLLIRHHLATREAAASLAVENLVYAGSVFASVAVGVVVALLFVPLPEVWRAAGVAALAVLAVAIAVAVRIMRGTWDASRGARPRWREKLASVRSAALEFTAGHPARLWRVFALDLAFHALSALEVFLALRWLLGSSSPAAAQAIVFDTLYRVTVIVFKPVPFRIGVDEALTGALAPLLNVTVAAGVTLAVVRKIRNLAWAAVGLAIVAAHPARSR
jgi:hypothetical protein